MVVDLKTYKKTRKLAVSIPFGEHIALARKNQEKTQIWLATRVGCDQSVVSRWETGALDVQPADAADIAEILNNPALLKHYCTECRVNQAYLKMCRNPIGAA